MTIPISDVIGCDVVLPKNEESDSFCCGGRKHIATVTILQGYIDIYYIFRPPKEEFKMKKYTLHVKAIPEKCYEMQRRIEDVLQRGRYK